MTDKETKVEPSPRPWKQSCFLVTSVRGDHVTHTGMGNLPPSRSHESEANAAHIVRCVNAHDALVEECERQRKLLDQLAPLAYHKEASRHLPGNVGDELKEWLKNRSVLDELRSAALAEQP